MCFSSTLQQDHAVDATERSVALVLSYAEYGRQHIPVQPDTSLAGWQKEEAEITCESGKKTKELGNPKKEYHLTVL